MKESIFSNAEKIALVVVFITCVATVVVGLRPVDYKKDRLPTIVMRELEDAIGKITANDSLDGTLEKLYKINSTKEFNITEDKEQSKDFGLLIEKYLADYNKPCENQRECGACSNYQYSFLLKSGACVGITTGKVENAPTIFPGETKPTNSTSNYGIIFYDINSINAPNQAGIDQFLVPLGAEGIEYVIE